ncbi:MAG: flagellar hook-length control protein FliK [Nitrosomonadales bacterium]|nr:flagellar hook-length control protein FliK [Nitrosomonadales bacterium]
MTSLPITNSNSQSLPANAATGAAQKNDTANAQPADPFGAVLARRIEAEEADASAPNTASPEPGIPEPGIEVKATVDPTIQANKAEQDKTLVAADTPNDLSAALVAMLQLPQEIKPPVVKDASVDTTASVITGVAATARGMADTAATARGMVGVRVISEVSAHKTDINQPMANAGTKQTKAGFGTATAAPGKTDAATMVAGNLTVADKPTSRNVAAPEIAGLAELPVNLADAGRSAQGVAQSVAAPGMLPNILANDKTASGLQAISSPLGSSGWAEEFSQKITWMGTQQNQVAELHLNPPNLGPLDVVLKISDNQATALFTSPHSAVRDAIENALPRLREMLADNGIMLGNTMVSDQSPRDRNADGLMDHGAGASARREASGNALEATGLLLTTAQTMPVRRHNGMVDTFA